MQKVDLVIAGIGVVALIATTLGIVFYDEATEPDEIQLETVTQDNYFEYGFGATAAGNTVEHDFVLPANATGASFAVTFDFQGQTGSGGTVNFAVHIVDPNGNHSEEFTGAMVLAANANSGSTTVDVPLQQWATQPDSPMTLNWDEPVKIVVTLSSPNGETFPTGLPAVGSTPVNYTFDVNAAGDLEMYREAVNVPNPGVL